MLPATLAADCKLSPVCVNTHEEPPAVQLFANPSTASRKSSLAMQRMEAQMQHNALLHKKTVAERARHAQALERAARAKRALNGQLQSQVVARARHMDAQLPILDRVEDGNHADTCARAPAAHCLTVLHMQVA